MNELFKERPIDKDTKIRAERYCSHDDKEFLLEHWYWDGITGTSAIFLEEQVQTMSDIELIQFAFSAMKLPVDTRTTVKRKNKGFAFINFNFDVHD